MKTAVFTLLLIIFFSLNIEEDGLIYEVHETEINWEDGKFKELTSSDKEYILKHLDYGCNKADKKEDLKKFKKIDLNGDGNLDLIYRDGCPYKEVSIFIVNTSGYESLISNQQGIITTVLPSNDKTILRIKQEPCCCMKSGSIQEYLFSNREKEIKKREVYWAVDFEFSDNNLATDLEENEILSNTKIRTSPKTINEEIKDECSDDVYNGNIIGEIKKGAQYKILDSKVDEEKNYWELVELISTDSYIPDGNSVQPYDKETTLVVGWIKIVD